MQFVLAFALVVLTALIASWDIIAMYNNDPTDTVSTVLRSWSVTWPILPLSVGVVIGHIFWK